MDETDSIQTIKTFPPSHQRLSGIFLYAHSTNVLISFAI
nr:MAG TPA: hypothetical protein [Caudoviricetes sp.]DAW86237.1 MAG TPA: hypothetical protein [Bacteriophage sp.]